MNKPKDQSKPLDPFASLPDEIIPEDYRKAQEATHHEDTPSDLMPDLSHEVGTELLVDVKRIELGKRRLLGRRLDREIKQLYEFLNLGLQSALVRVGTKSAATNRRNKFYFARKQELILANAALTRGAEGAEDRLILVDQMYTIELSTDHDDKGWFVRLDLEADSELEPA